MFCSGFRATEFDDISYILISADRIAVQPKNCLITLEAEESPKVSRNHVLRHIMSIIIENVDMKFVIQYGKRNITLE